jgi:NodT family efflux transporter outer membrane factor (OMF) lipoprotein
MRSLSIIAATATLMASAATASLGAQSTTEGAEEPALIPFWRQLGDTTLERLTREALRANYDVHAAEARVRGARAARRLAAFDFAPTITSSAGFARRRFSATQLPGAPASFREQDVYDAGFDASWEVDIFGRVRGAVAAQSALAGSASEELRYVQLSLVSELARTYFELRGAQRQLAVAEQNAANQQRTLRYTVDRLAAGRGTAFDRERASALVSMTLAGVTAIEARIAAANYRIGVLVGGQRLTSIASNGTPADEVVSTAPLPPLPAVPAMESVAALIRRRPDVRSAERRVTAQGALVNVARAEYLPRLNVIGSVGFNAGAVDLLGKTESSRYVIGPVLSWPAFDLGRVRARVEGARAQADEARARYDQIVLIAQAEAENAIVAYDRSRARVVLLQEAARSSERGAELARLRLDGGEADFLELLDAQRTLLDAQDRLAQGGTDAATAFLALYKALGGGWVGSISAR